MTTAQKLLVRITGVTTAAMLAMPAFAEGFDTSALIAMLALIATAAGLIGVTVLGIFASIKGYKMIRAAL